MERCGVIVTARWPTSRLVGSHFGLEQRLHDTAVEFVFAVLEDDDNSRGVIAIRTLRIVLARSPRNRNCARARSTHPRRDTCRNRQKGAD
ncbi:hypothetical protein CH252_07095 [Rhodococcus sp. 06-1477-1B]|nr:hypothetical protein CH252_07095 [Rhodococcus sp. 06-1477-1B]